MLEVTFYRDGRGRTARISARGHADFAEHGQDIVCSAASAILQAARLGLEAHLGAVVRAAQKAGRFELGWREADRDLESLRAIVLTAELAIDRIAQRYPNHVRLRRRGIGQRMRSKALGRVTSLANRRRGHDV